MQMTDKLRRLLASAADRRMPFAVWRMPDGETFEAAISVRPAARHAVFGRSTSQAFFAMARFEMPDGNVPEAISADILVRGNQVMFHDGSAYVGAPVNAMQAGLVNKDAGSVVRTMEQSSGYPVQTGRRAYEALVARTVAAIRQGPCRKIVLSRVEAQGLPDGHDLLGSVEALASAYPSAFVALVSSVETGTWLVATPETLMSVSAGGIHTMALAGTQWPQGDPDLAELTWPDKIIEEQGLVADYIRDTFAQCGIEGVTETAPRTVRAANLCHLRSDFTARVSNDAGHHPAALALLLNRLHPTSAVCGMPKPAAKAFLAKNEGYDRRYYTGYLGPVGIDGRTDLFVNLRSAEVIGSTLFLHVGGGIVIGSDPALEWEETVQKTRTIGQIVLRDFGSRSKRGLPRARTH